MSDDFFETQDHLGDVELSANRVSVGDDVNLTEMDPTLRNVLIGAGWEVNVFDSEVMDVDLSVFLLNAKGETREDADFVFYNAPETCEGSVRHTGDSRTGAGDGDDETVKIDLTGIPFDVVKVVFVLSIYKGLEKDQSMSMVRDGFLRIVNADTNIELVRYELDSDIENKTEKAMIVGSLNREGPKWHFTPIGEFAAGGLKEVATNYGLIIINQ